MPGGEEREWTINRRRGEDRHFVVGPTLRPGEAVRVVRASRLADTERERDQLAKALNRAQDAALAARGGDILAVSKPRFDEEVARAKKAEAEAAEYREALERIAQPVYAEGKESGWPCPHRDIARAALSNPPTSGEASDCICGPGRVLWDCPVHGATSREGTD